MSGVAVPGYMHASITGPFRYVLTGMKFSQRVH